MFSMTSRRGRVRRAYAGLSERSFRWVVLPKGAFAACIYRPLCTTGFNAPVFRDLTARGLSGVSLVTADAHRGLTGAIGATLPAASWQRCRTHYSANLMSRTPKSAWGWVKALLHSVYEQPDAASAHAQFDRVIEAREDKRPDVARISPMRGRTFLRSRSSRPHYGSRSGRTIRRSG